MTSPAKFLRLAFGYKTPVAQTNIAVTSLKRQIGMFGQKGSIKRLGDGARIFWGLSKPDKWKLRGAVRPLYSQRLQIALLLSRTPLVQLRKVNHSLLLHPRGRQSSDSRKQFKREVFASEVTT